MGGAIRAGHSRLPVPVSKGAAASERVVVVGAHRRPRGFESWLDRDSLLHLDFDPSVVGIASQPFWLHWADAVGTTVSHAPDFFARRTDGSAVVVDCRPVERRKPRDVAKFDTTARACALVGWDYRLLGAAEALVTANLRWFAGYRHPRHYLPETVEVLRHMFATPTPLMCGAEAAGDPIAVLPVLFHLLWCQELRIDVDAAASGHAGEPAGGSAVTLTQAAVLRPGDWVRYDGGEHQVAADSWDGLSSAPASCPSTAPRSVSQPHPPGPPRPATSPNCYEWSMWRDAFWFHHTLLVGQ